VKLDISKVEVKNNVLVGDIIVIRYKGVRETTPFLICDIDDEIKGISLNGKELLLDGPYYTIEGLVEDLRSEPLVEEISIYPYTSFILSLEAKNEN
jgi:hypothetical protein